METDSYHVLFVGDIKLETMTAQKPVSQFLEIPLQFMQVSTYSLAILAVQQGAWNAIYVAQYFDGHTGLEFIHHSRLIDAETPIILLCEDYNDSLDYKSRRIGATDCASIKAIDPLFFQSTLAKRKHSSRHEKGPRAGFRILNLIEGFFSA